MTSTPAFAILLAASLLCHGCGEQASDPSAEAETHQREVDRAARLIILAMERDYELYAFCGTDRVAMAGDLIALGEAARKTIEDSMHGSTVAADLESVLIALDDPIYVERMRESRLHPVDSEALIENYVRALQQLGYATHQPPNKALQTDRASPDR